MKKLTITILALVILCSSGCITWFTVDQARDNEPGLYFLLPLTVAADIVTSPLQLIGFIFLANSSCPYIYVNNGEKFVLTGEVYSGAILAPLERDDYLLLPIIVPVKGKYKLKVTNELKEIQHTNLMELIVIDHPKKTNVLIDKYGNYQTITNIKTPKTATNFSGTDILKIIKNKDSLSYYGASPYKDVPLTDGAILTFDIPENTQFLKLFIRAKNSVWLDVVYKNIYDLMGNYNDSWRDRQNKKEPAKIMEWSLSQKIPLSIYIEKNGEWVFCDYYNMAGPAALKDDVIALDLKGIGEGPLKIKLEAGTYFWEIDYVGIDYTENVPVDIKTVKIENAITENNENVTDILKYDDSTYYVQPDTTNVAVLDFAVPAFTDSERTIILHSKGYYQMINDAKGLPKIKKLKETRQFLEYSHNLLENNIKRQKEQGIVNKN